MIMLPLMISETMFEWNTVHPPSVDCFLQRTGDVMAQCQAPWLVGVKSFAWMSWQEVRKTPG